MEGASSCPLMMMSDDARHYGGLVAVVIVRDYVHLERPFVPMGSSRDALGGARAWARRMESAQNLEWRLAELVCRAERAARA